MSANTRVLNEKQDSPGRSPASRVFPQVLKSPKHVCRRVISIPSARTRWCMCTLVPMGLLHAFASLRCRDGNWSICAASENPNDALAGWRHRACIRDVGGERQEESVRVRTEQASFPQGWESGPKRDLHDLQFSAVNSTK